MNEDGPVDNAPVYFVNEDGQIIIAKQKFSRKIRNNRRSNNL